MTGAPVATFVGLVDLAAQGLGGRALGASDDFFAAAENLVKPGRAVFIEGKYTERGKWMDGWESRRKRTPGHDWCLLELGVAGRVLGFDIDTQHFVGNSPSFASVDGLHAPKGTSLEVLAQMKGVELLAPSPLRPDAQNLFAARPGDAVSHLRLHIFPDGGVARFRAFGEVQPTWDAGEMDGETRARVAPRSVDLAALENGGLALACSDAFFGPMNNLLLPERADNMGGGWETRRKRGPGSDWIIVGLGARGVATCVEVDTNHFVGNYPDRCSIEWIDAPGAPITDLIASPGWAALLPATSLRAHARHFFDGRSFDEAFVRQPSPASHVRLNIFPDGGVSRLRLWGTRA
jgi:allantoicase